MHHRLLTRITTPILPVRLIAVDIVPAVSYSSIFLDVRSINKVTVYITDELIFILQRELISFVQDSRKNLSKSLIKQRLFRPFQKTCGSSYPHSTTENMYLQF